MSKLFGYIVLAALVGGFLTYDGAKTANRYRDRKPDEVTMQDIMSGKVKHGDWVRVSGYQSYQYEVDYNVKRVDSTTHRTTGSEFSKYTLLISPEDPAVDAWESVCRTAEEAKSIRISKIEGFGSGEGLRLNKLVQAFNSRIDKVKPHKYIAVSLSLGSMSGSLGSLLEADLAKRRLEAAGESAQPSAKPEDKKAAMARWDKMSVSELQEELDKLVKANQQGAEKELASLAKTMDVVRLQKVAVSGIVGDVPDGVQGKFCQMVPKPPTIEIKDGKEPLWEFVKYFKICIIAGVVGLIGLVASVARQ